MKHLSRRKECLTKKLENEHGKPVEVFKWKRRWMVLKSIRRPYRAFYEVWSVIIQYLAANISEKNPNYCYNKKDRIFFRLR